MVAKLAKTRDTPVLLAHTPQEEQEGRVRNVMEGFQKLLDEQAAKQKEEPLVMLTQLESNFVAQTKQLADSAQTSIQNLESRFTSLAIQFTTERAKHAGLVGMHSVGKSSRRKHGLVA